MTAGAKGVVFDFGGVIAYPPGNAWEAYRVAAELGLSRTAFDAAFKKYRYLWDGDFIDGIEMYRRKSGGGCVYADEGNLMISYITSQSDVNKAFDEYLSRLADALRSMGLDAVRTEHNDVLVGGRKVSGNACYATRTGCIVHGTLLYDVDFGEMERAITPSKEKLDSKGIKSVRQRVTNLKDCGLLFDFEVLKSKLIDYFCKDMQFLSNPDMDEVLKIEQTYLDEKFIKYGRRN